MPSPRHKHQRDLCKEESHLRRLCTKSAKIQYELCFLDQNCTFRCIKVDTTTTQFVSEVWPSTSQGMQQYVSQLDVDVPFLQ